MVLVFGGCTKLLKIPCHGKNNLTMKKIFILLLVITLAIRAYTQITVSGYVSDAETGEKIIGALIWIEETSFSSETNSFGYFALTAPFSENMKLSVANIGYTTQTILISENRDTTKNFNLTHNNSIDAVTVEANKNDIFKNTAGKIQIPVQSIKKIPSLGGEQDIFKAMQLMPGIQSGSEGRNTLNVRGSSSDQNLVLLDDIPLYYVNHLGGFVSVFNPDAISDFSMYKGGFPARYGGRLASAADIRMKDGNNNKLSGSGSIGIISTRLSINGPIRKAGTTFMVSARRFMLDLLTKPLSGGLVDGLSAGYSFYDFNAKISHKISNKSKLFLSFYKGKDKISSKYQEKKGLNTYLTNNSWGNTFTSLRYTYTPTSKIFLKLTTAYTKYDYELRTELNTSTKNYSQNMYSSVNDLFIKPEVVFFIPNGEIRAGINSVKHNFIPRNLTFEVSDSASTNLQYANIKELQSFENEAYIEYDAFLFKNFGVNLGLRSSLISVQDTNFIMLSPRVLLNYKLNSLSALKFTFSEMEQSMHRLISSGNGLASELWMPVTKNVPPEKAMQFGFAYEHLLFKKRFELSIELYAKTMENLIAYKEGANLSESYTGNWEEIVETSGKGTAYGLEFLLRKKTGQLTGWMAYTYAKSDRQFTNINKGKVFPFKYDRRHDISFVLDYEVNERINFSVTWSFGSGLPISLEAGFFDAIRTSITSDGTAVIDYMPVSFFTEKNSVRMKPFHKLDLAAQFSKKKKRYRRVLSLNIYNAYNRQNPYYYYYDRSDKYKPKLYQVSYFPFIPSVSYSFEF